MLNYQQILAQLQQNQQVMNNQTVQSVFDCLNRRDHSGLIQLYKNTCQTMGVQPNQNFIR